MKLRKILISILLITVLVAGTACKKGYEEVNGGFLDLLKINPREKSETVTVTKSNKEGNVISTLNRSTGISLDENGNLVIQRISRKQEKPMGEEDTWTIFVYVCGTDLESNNSMATYDMQEMIEATSSDRVKFVVQTGGTNVWNNDLVTNGSIQRYVIQNQWMQLEDERKLANMGEAKTLTDFLEWGITNHPAEKMGVVFWNHGGGSITGVCFDEVYNWDSLSLTEIEEAFTTVYPNMTDKFEFIGFDACLMGSIEVANVLAPHARYMYASEELEPGYGWDYGAIGDFLAYNPSADGADLGVVVVDSYYDSCVYDGTESEITLSCIELSKIDDVMIAFHKVAQNIYDTSDNTLFLSKTVKGFRSAESYGGNNKAEGYTNMVDLGSILVNLSSHVEGAEEALELLNECVIYMRNGINKSRANGLSIYYPLAIQGSSELAILKDICISPHYMSFIDKIAYGYGTNGLVDSYNDEIWLGNNSDYWVDSYDNDEGYGSEYWAYLEGNTDTYNFDESETAISLAQEPYFDEDGTFGLIIAEDALDYVASVYCSVFYDTGDGDTLLDLGIDDNVYIYLDTGEVYDNFNGYWPALPDGQPLATFLVEQGDGYNMYTSPILLNGEETNLRIRMNYKNENDYSIYIVGAWQGIDEVTGQSAKEMIKLKRGDIIVPTYNAYTMSTGNESQYYGYEYEYVGDRILSESYLFAGDYYYAFIIEDIFGGSLYTDFALFTIDEEGNLYFDELVY